MTSRKILVRAFLTATPACILLAATVAQAATGGFVPLADSSQSPMLSNVYGSKDLGAYVNALFTTALSVGAILAVLRIAYAGYQYMTTDAWGSKQNAKEILGDVTLGIMLLLSIFLILKQINPDLLKLDVLTKVNQASSAPSSPSGQNATQQFSTPPAQNSFLGGAGGYDPSLNGCGVGGCGNQQDTINTGGNPGGY